MLSIIVFEAGGYGWYEKGGVRNAERIRHKLEERNYIGLPPGPGRGHFLPHNIAVAGTAIKREAPFEA